MSLGSTDTPWFHSCEDDSFAPQTTVERYALSPHRFITSVSTLRRKSAEPNSRPDILTGIPTNGTGPVGYQAQSNIGSEGERSRSYHGLEALLCLFDIWAFSGITY